MNWYGWAALVALLAGLPAAVIPMLRRWRSERRKEQTMSDAPVTPEPEEYEQPPTVEEATAAAAAAAEAEPDEDDDDAADE